MCPSFLLFFLPFLLLFPLRSSIPSYDTAPCGEELSCSGMYPCQGFSGLALSSLHFDLLLQTFGFFDRTLLSEPLCAMNRFELALFVLSFCLSPFYLFFHVPADPFSSCYAKKALFPALAFPECVVCLLYAFVVFFRLFGLTFFLWCRSYAIDLGEEVVVVFLARRPKACLPFLFSSSLV